MHTQDRIKVLPSILKFDLQTERKHTNVQTSTHTVGMYSFTSAQLFNACMKKATAISCCVFPLSKYFTDSKIKISMEHIRFSVWQPGKQSDRYVVFG